MFRNLRLVYVTTSNREEAKKLARILVEERLVACANIVDGMDSVYRWEGKVVEEKECLLLLKTPYHNLPKITRKIKAHHSYDVPCVISMTLTEQEGNEEYLDWILDEAPHSETEIRVNEKD